MAVDWQDIASAPDDGSIVNLYCPGACGPTQDVLQGCWNDRLKVWTLNPYGSTNFTSLFPTKWCDLTPPPT